MVDRIYSLPNYKNSLLEILNKQRCPNSQEEFKAGFGNLSSKKQATGQVDSFHS